MERAGGERLINHIEKSESGSGAGKRQRRDSGAALGFVAGDCIGVFYLQGVVIGVFAEGVALRGKGGLEPPVLVKRLVGERLQDI